MMDFQNINSLNVRLNLISGNLLPMIDRNLSFPFFWKMYSVLVWKTQFILATVIIFGCIYVPIEKALQDGMISIAVIIEMFFMILRIWIRKNLVHQLIRKLNEILYTADETMKNVVMTTLDPVKKPLNFYLSAGIISIIAWNCMSIILIFEKNLFYYKDYRIPAVFSNQPFSFRVFLLGSLFILISGVFTFIKKVGVDVYIIHLVLITTAQYRYIMLKIAIIFKEKNQIDEIQKKHSFKANLRKKEKEIKALCGHHNNVIHISLLLKKLLSLNFSLIYINSVFRFCFIGIMLSNIVSTTFWEAISIVMYTSGAIVQLYILCSCVQHLLDASTEMTDKAFYENWYIFQPSIKRIFIFIIMANSLECKIATFERFNLSLPSFMTILNQSYSIALLFLKMK